MPNSKNLKYLLIFLIIVLIIINNPLGKIFKGHKPVQMLEIVTEPPVSQVSQQPEIKQEKPPEIPKEVEKDIPLPKETQKEYPYNRTVYEATGGDLGGGIKHYKYEETNANDLVDVGNGQQLHKDAAKDFFEMQKAAAKEGIDLWVASGFRSYKHQQGIIDRKIAAGQSPEKIYSVSAPVNFSEHHSGYGADLVRIEENFQYSDAYKYLVKNASKFNFELSFPRGNRQGIAYEPWHWRFIGTEQARAVFSAARAN